MVSEASVVFTEEQVQFPCRFRDGIWRCFPGAKGHFFTRGYPLAMNALTFNRHQAPENLIPAKPGLGKTLGDHFFRANQLVPPEETALHPHHNSPIFFREIGRLVTNHAM